MAHGYERIGTFLPEEVLPFIPVNTDKQVIRNYAGKAMSLNRKKLLIFAAKGINCVCCGVKGTIFAVERHAQATRWHFNVYAVSSQGGERQITIDHIIPKSLGGTRSIANLQPMCEVCNRKKGNKLPYSLGLSELDSSWLPFSSIMGEDTKLNPMLRPLVVKKKFREKNRYEQLCFFGKYFGPRKIRYKGEIKCPK